MQSLADALTRIDRPARPAAGAPGRARPRWRRVATAAAREQRRLAVLLLGPLALMLLLAAVIPQQGATPPIEYGRWRQAAAPLSLWLEAMGLTAATRSLWLPAAGGLVGVGLAAYLAWQATGLARRGVRGWLAATSLGGLGSIVFHASLAVAGLILAASVLVRFAGYAELAPGASLADRSERYLTVQRGPLATASSDLTVRLDALRLVGWPDGSLREQQATISILREGRLVSRAPLARGDALGAEGITVGLGARTGPAVLLVAEDGLGQRAGWVHFPAWPGDGEVEAPFTVPQTDVHVALTLAGARLDRTDAAELTVRPLGPAAGAAGRRLQRGESTTAAALRLTFADVGAWSGVTVTRDPFIAWAFLAAGVGVVGLALATVCGRARGGAR